jgi:hypothetical protein
MIPRERGLNGDFEGFSYALSLKSSSLISLSFSRLSL